MLTSHELIGFMPAALAAEILEYADAEERELYKATLAAVAQARKVRPVFLERQPRAARHPVMLAMLARPAMDAAAGTLLRGWLLKRHRPLLADFLDALGIAHKDGAVEDLPATMDDAKLKAAIETVLARHPREVVIIYLNAFNSMNDQTWPNLDTMLKSDERLHL